ncbi:MAG: aminoacyl--tRNA ligase-related protein [Thermoproteota archaeon]
MEKVRRISFRARATLKLSKPLEEEKRDELSKWIKLRAGELLSKGTKVKEEAAKIENFEVFDNKISLEISSGRSVRPHDALARLRKAIGEELGKKLGIGVREIQVEDYEIIFEGSNFKKVNLPFTKEVTTNENEARVKLNLTEKEIYSQVPDRIVKLFLEKQQEAPTGKEIHEIKWSSQQKPHKYDVDPNLELVKRGWVKRFDQGIWYYMPPFAALMRAMEKIIVEEIAVPNGFVEAYFPKLITLEVMRKKGQLYGIPNEMFYVCEPISRDVSYFEDYMDKVKVTNETLPTELLGKLKPPTYALPYAQCEPFYEIFSGEIVDVDQGPIKLFDRSGFSFRYESGGLTGLERLNAFNRIEITYLGTPEQVVEIRDKLVDSYQRVLDKTLDLEVRTVEVTPVWMAHAGVTSDVQRSIPATLDFEVYLPYRGERETSEWLEVGNASVHFDKYMQWYNVKEKKEREVWTGCSGNGLERWVISLLANHGFNPEDWPKDFRKYLGKLPENIKLVTWP